VYQSSLLLTVYQNTITLDNQLCPINSLQQYIASKTTYHAHQQLTIGTTVLHEKFGQITHERAVCEIVQFIQQSKFHGSLLLVKLSSIWKFVILYFNCF